MKRAAVFTFATPNLGDEMQSYAALAHLSRVHQFLDRDHLADYASVDDVTCVFNSWFLLGDDFRLPSTRIHPVWHGFSGGREELYQEPWLSFLKELGPIGCRDLFTANRLCDHGVAAEWTGCLTLFLGRALSQRSVERRGILFVDLPPAAEAYIPADLRRRAIRLSTFPAPDVVNKPLQRWAAVARIADRLAHAELVVTRRLHVALPAASFGTPVVAVPDPEIGQARTRFSGFDTIIPTVYLDQLAGLSRIDWRNIPSVSVPPAIEQRYAAFKTLLATQQIADGQERDHTGLDDLEAGTHRLINASALGRPGELRLRLADCVFGLEIRFWCDQYVDVALSGFPGLSKFEFEVEYRGINQTEWRSWGLLRTAVIPSTDSTARLAA